MIIHLKNVSIRVRIVWNAKTIGPQPTRGWMVHEAAGTDDIVQRAFTFSSGSRATDETSLGRLSRLLWLHGAHGFAADRHQR